MAFSKEQNKRKERPILEQGSSPRKRVVCTLIGENKMIGKHSVNVSLFQATSSTTPTRNIRVDMNKNSAPLTGHVGKLSLVTKMNGSNDEVNTPDISLESFGFEKTTVMASGGAGIRDCQEENSFPPSYHPAPAASPVSTLPMNWVPSSPEDSQSGCMKQNFDIMQFLAPPTLKHLPLSTDGLQDLDFMSQNPVQVRRELSAPLVKTEPTMNGHGLKSASVVNSLDNDVHVSEQDTEFKIPQDILEMLNNIVPAEFTSTSTYDIPFSTEDNFDLYIGRQNPSNLAMEFQDLLGDALAQAGILDLNQELGLLTEKVTVGKEITKPLLLEERLNSSHQDPNDSLCDLDISLEYPQSPSIFLNAISPPSAKTSPDTSSVKQRRRSKKPLRFKDMIVDTDSVILESDLPLFSDHPQLDYNPSTSRTSSGKRKCSHMSKEDKYVRCRQLNNEASKRCRQKRKMTLKEMEKEIPILEGTNKKLRSERDLVEKLKTRMQTLVNNYFGSLMKHN